MPRRDNKAVTHRIKQGFTLIEILIVVMILGILAAIVVPQFGTASKDAKTASLVSTVQTMRGQIGMFRLQHNDWLPGATPLTGSGATFDQTTFWNQLTLYSDIAGNTNATRTTTFDKGPYMQGIPKNSLCPTAGAESDVAATVDGAASATVVGFIYDYQGGAGSGRIWGTNTDGKTAVVQ
jgi:general secretion pathway protein G